MFSHVWKSNNKLNILKFWKDNDVFKAGQVAGSTTADSFLRSNPRWFIESALGKKRAALFIDKKINITKFTDLNGRPLTLQQLKDSGV